MTQEEANQLEYREYIGDAVYVGFDGCHIWLTTENGITVTNAIALEPNVLHEFQLWLQNTLPHDSK